MRWLVTGSNGMLGTDLVTRLVQRGEDVTAEVLGSLDLGDGQAVDEAVAKHDFVVNCAAWTAVDDAEAHEPEAHHVNAEIPERLAVSAAKHRTPLVHLSTDYVFNGTATEAYREDASRSPQSAYGRTKAAGEIAVLRESPEFGYVVRTAWLYGAHGDCFPKTIVRLARERGSVSVVTDQIGQPTWTVDVADVIIGLMETSAAPGVYHATSSGHTSWFEFSQEIVRSIGLDPSIIHPTTSEEFVRPAARPAYSVLGHQALENTAVLPIGDWRARWRAAADSVLV